MVLVGRYDPRKVEEEISQWWRENNIIKKVFEMNHGAPVYAFLEGPPTVNGFMHVGHARGRVYKDIILRYNSMKGFDIWRRAGWDCLGLPTEIEVEKKLGFTSKKDVEAYGLDKFVEEANKLVDYYIKHWREASEKLGLWLDYDNAYETRKERYIEHIWWFIKQAYEKGDLVESFKVVPYCPRCETPLSSHEVAQGYEEVEDPSIYVKFPVEGSKNLYIIIWTTTPWTLAGNEAIAVNPAEQYVKLKVDEEEWIVAEKLLQKFVEEIGLTNYEVVDRFKGSAIAGLRYRHPLLEKVPKHYEHNPPAHTVITADFVTMEEGTGCVHTAPAHGPEDYEVGVKLGLPIFNPVSTSGYFTSEGGEYAELYYTDAGRKIIEYLREKKLLIWEGKILHNYPHCWRCGSPLIYLASRQWFLKVDRIKDIMINENKKVLWKPAWAGYSRFGDWLINAEDWCISRTKVWGTPLPVWICSNCREKKVVGSKKELLEAEIKPQEIRLLRPWVDQVMFKCPRCGGWMKREQFVMDTWLDSGMAHTASIDALSNPKLFDKLFPYDFITEAIDQTRGWFYTLLFTSCLLYGRAPYKLVLNQGHVMDAEGKKMSKSRGNVIWAIEAMDRFGVDPLRLYLVSKSAPWDNMNFVPKEVDQVLQELNILWNVFVFATTYFKLDKFNPEHITVNNVRKHLKLEDRWILSRINSLTKIVTKQIEQMEIHSATRELREFIVEDLSRLYIRAIRRRVWIEEQTWDKLAVYATLYYTLKKLLLLIAPITPYIAEKLYQEIKLPEDLESIHMNKWPRVDEEWLDEELEDMMETARQTLREALSARQKAGRKLRSPIKTLILSPKTFRVKKILENFKEFLRSQLNVLEIKILDVGEKHPEVRYVVKPVYKLLGPKYGEKLKEIIERLNTVDVELMKNEIETSGSYSMVLSDGTTVRIEQNEVEFEEKLPDHILKEDGKFAEIYLDLTESKELIALSLGREVIRRIQVMRKEMNLNILDYISTTISTPDEEWYRYLEMVKEMIKEETRSSHLELKIGGEVEGYVKEWDIEGDILKIGVRKV
ncbi:MAG: isoleucine--tRNA ligase [Aigarchaeota archaeon]|nr:isoleucine--tRNA ligase [Candidatus Geocrenenecus dongiae]